MRTAATSESRSHRLRAAREILSTGEIAAMLSAFLVGVGCSPSAEEIVPPPAGLAPPGREPPVPARRAAGTESRKFRVRVTGEHAEGIRASFAVRDPNPGGNGKPFERLRFSPDGACDVEYPADSKPTLMAEGDGLFVWPAVVVPSPGAEIELRAEPLRSVVIRLPADRPALSELRVLAVPDRLWSGPDDAVRADALDHATSDCVETLREVAGTVHLVGLFPAAYNVFLIAGPRTAYAYLPADATSLDVSAPWASRRYVVELSIDGQAPRPGSIIAPGRLDLVSLGALRGRFAKHFGAFSVVQDASEWAPFDLPAASSLTVWQPELGTVWIDSPEKGRIDAKSGPCAIALRAPDNATFTGTVTVWQAWQAGRALFVRPHDATLGHTVSGAPEFVIRGLAPGRYRIEYKLDVARTPPVRAYDTADVVVSATSPLSNVTVRTP